MIKPKLLNELKGKIINVTTVFPDSPINYSNLKLIDYDEDFIKIVDFTNFPIFLSKSIIFTIEPADKYNSDKFYEYSKKYKKDKNFRGDNNETKKEGGYFG